MPRRATRAAVMPSLVDRQRPGLSETLTGPKDPRLCQSCGAAHHPGNELRRWAEADAWDKLIPASPVLVLCAQCSGRLIDPHPRLYHALDNGSPWPGCMSVCVRCTLRDGVTCTSPDRATLKMGWEKKPTFAFLCGPGLSGGRHFFDGPVKRCSGRVPRTMETVHTSPHTSAGGAPT